ncbi:PREDICTED: uncharacterized protein LOC106747696 isoform X2 [Dinoponera quadriceps]|uniref:Uncharacterized protein LOC106747696 isoform X2 n=1 Tax=Dinoponera quadriceps TaxID=609295 RepID=A0A6P3XRV0_DINQU|nr:PREDICTED: uncharacterized protein LOC106747696 isoform X2 [Dinoponera quadriceps]
MMGRKKQVRIMIRLVSVLVLVGLANGQLNFEGNPLTEYTDYTAEESSLSERAAKDTSVYSNSAISRPQRLYPVFETPRQPAKTMDNELFSDHRLQAPRVFSVQSPPSARQLQTSTERSSPIDPAEVALTTFLNSKTPEESRASLDYFLRSQQSEAQSRSADVAVIDQDERVDRVDTQPIIHQVEQRQPLLPQTDQTIHVHLTPQVVPQQVNQQRQQLPASQNFVYAPQPLTQAAVQPVIRTSAGILGPATMLQPMPIGPGIQMRNDPMMSATMWRQRMKRLRGKPLPGVFPQARIAPALYKGPVAVPFKAPVEVIYTKPPGFHRGPANVIANPPFEDASSWFPDSDYPPPSKDVYYSQLYAQSYDPHYYNYIAATGKVRPHLYGKLGKRKEEQEDGIWSELYRGFTKHGLKNIMTPTFLLGMTLPVVTLMLSALVQKRSIARSDARDLGQEDALQEYLERLQRAMICYGSNRSTASEGKNEC